MDERQVVTVLRQAKLREINVGDLVVGDVIKIFEGMEIPTDGFLVESNEVTVDESAMTGETDPIKKNVYSKSIEICEQLAETNKMDKYSIPSPILISGTKVITNK